MFDPKADLVNHFRQARLARVEPDLGNITTGREVWLELVRGDALENDGRGVFGWTPVP